MVHGAPTRDTAPQAGDFVTPALRLVRPLGAGGMGAVWVAEHLTLRTRVAVKFLSQELALNADALARFSREAAAASQVKSPHVVHVSDHGIAANGAPFIAMELLDGSDLRGLLTQRRVLPPHEIAAIVAQVARALMAAHQRGIVHRDIKPENLFLTDAGGGELFVKVLDFGIAKSTVGDVSLATGTGAMVGTPLYMAPEQILGQKTIDFRADLWSLGVVVFEALTGAPPFVGETIGALSVAICGGAAPRPSDRDPRLPPAVDAWFQRACSREPAQRFASAREMADALAVAAGQAASSSGAFASPVEPWATSGTAIPPTAQRPPPPVGMLTTGGAASSATDSAPDAARSRTRRLVLWGALAAGVGVLGGLAAFSLGSRTNQGPPIDASTPRAPAAAKEREAPTTSEPPSSEAPASTAPGVTAPSASATSATSRSTPNSAGSAPPPKASAAPSNSTAPPASAAPPAATGRKPNDVVLE